MKRYDFITPYTGLTEQHLQDLRKSIDLGHATWGSIWALDHCDVITVWLDGNESFVKIEALFRKCGYTEINNFSL